MKLQGNKPAVYINLIGGLSIGFCNFAMFVTVEAMLVHKF